MGVRQKRLKGVLRNVVMLEVTKIGMCTTSIDAY